MLLPHGPGLQSRRDLPDTGHRHFGPVFGGGISDRRETRFQRADRPWNDGRGRRDREGLSSISDHGERGEPAGLARDEGIPVHRGDGRTYGERGADLRRPQWPPGIRRRAAEDAREADAPARRAAEGHAASWDLGSEERGLDRDPVW